MVAAVFMDVDGGGGGPTAGSRVLLFWLLAFRRWPIPCFFSLGLAHDRSEPGRLVSVLCTNNDESLPSFSVKEDTTWGVILNFERVKGVSEDDSNKKPEDANYTLVIPTRCLVHKDEIGKKTTKIVPMNHPGEAAVISIALSQVHSVSSIRPIIPNDLLPVDARENTLKKMSEVLSRFSKDGLPLLDPEDDMKVRKLARQPPAPHPFSMANYSIACPLVQSGSKRKSVRTPEIRGLGESV